MINDATIFQKNSVNLVIRMVKQGGKINRLSITLNKLYGRYFDVFQKDNNSSFEFIVLLLN